jgi:cobalt-zinc-cadmium efflux system protein
MSDHSAHAHSAEAPCPGHDHHHGHDHHGHHHGHSHAAGVTDERLVAWAFVIIFAFMLIEVAGGLFSGSLALLADAGHMVSDAAALGMSWAALRIGKRPADARRSYGYQRLEVLVAFVNGCSLFVIAGWIVLEAVLRFARPVPVLGGPMLAVAIAGLLANLLAFLVLNGGDRANLNMRSAWLHVLGDMLGFGVAIVAALVILATGWSPIDPILSILVALLILKSAGGIVRASSHILLEGTPPGLDLAAMGADLEAHIPDVAEIHHIHAWSLTAEQAMVTLHVRAEPGADPAGIVPAVAARLQQRFGIAHSTIQLDAEDCPDEDCR